MSENLIALWHRAARSPVGLAISTDDRALLRQQLYRARAEVGDPKLDDLVMLLPAIKDEVWIIHRGADVGV